MHPPSMGRFSLGRDQRNLHTNLIMIALETSKDVGEFRALEHDRSGNFQGCRGVLAGHFTPDTGCLPSPSPQRLHH